MGVNQAFDDLCRCNVEIRNRVMDSETVQSPCPCFGAAGVDDLDAIPLGLAENPRYVGCGVLDLLVLEVF